MNQKEQEAIDAKIQEGNKPLKTHRVVGTGVSKKPVLGAGLLDRKSKKVFVVECLIDDEEFKMGVRRGVPYEFGLMLRQTNDVFALTRKPDADDNTLTQKQRSEEERKALIAENKRLYQIMVASMVVEIDEETDEPVLDDEGNFIPVFSYNGIGGEIPIEDQSDIMLNVLYSAVQEVQAPTEAADALNRFQNGSRKRGRRTKKSGA